MTYLNDSQVNDVLKSKNIHATLNKVVDEIDKVLVVNPKGFVALRDSKILTPEYDLVKMVKGGWFGNIGDIRVNISRYGFYKNNSFNIYEYCTYEVNL